MSLKRAATRELRAELRRREERQRKREEKKFLAWAEEHPCPICEELPIECSVNAVEEFRFAPRDSDGFPMVFAPYEMGTTEGMRYEKTASCARSHTWHIEDHIKWFDKPYNGPPVLGRKT